MKYHLALGGNLGDRIENLDRARVRLVNRGIAIRASSVLYETEPVVFSAAAGAAAGAPGFAWESASASKAHPLAQPWHINQAIEVETELSPLKLLRLLKEIEKEMGREATVPDGPRVIDLDILLAEDTIILTGELTIPHPRLAERNFVLVPLAEIAPEAVHPVLKRTIRELLRCSKDKSKIKRYEPAKHDNG